MTGWVRLYRSLYDHPLWTRGRFTPGQAWADLLMLANFHDGKVHQGNVWIPVLRGQVFTSQVSLSKRWRWNRKTTSGFLRSLNLDNMVDIETSRRTDTGYTLITIRNYDKYQGSETEDLDIQTDTQTDIRRDIEGTSKVHPVPTSEERKKGIREAMRPLDAAGRGNGKLAEYQAVVDHWFQEFEQARGSRPQFDKAEGASLKRLLGGQPVELVKAVITHMLTRTQLRHIRERHAYTIHSLLGSWNELASEYRKRAAEEGDLAQGSGSGQG